MEFQYTTVDTELGAFTLVRTFTPDDAALAAGEHFREFFVEASGDTDIVVVYRNEEGLHEWYSSFPLPMSDAELDAEIWTEGEWWP